MSACQRGRGRAKEAPKELDVEVCIFSVAGEEIVRLNALTGSVLFPTTGGPLSTRVNMNLPLRRFFEQYKKSLLKIRRHVPLSFLNLAFTQSVDDVDRLLPTKNSLQKSISAEVARLSDSADGLPGTEIDLTLMIRTAPMLKLLSIPQVALPGRGMFLNLVNAEHVREPGQGAQLIFSSWREFCTLTNADFRREEFVGANILRSAWEGVPELLFILREWLLFCGDQGADVAARIKDKDGDNLLEGICESWFQNPPPRTWRGAELPNGPKTALADGVRDLLLELDLWNAMVDSWDRFTWWNSVVEFHGGYLQTVRESSSKRFPDSLQVLCQRQSMSSCIFTSRMIHIVLMAPL